MKDISIITVNYKTPELTKECIESVLRQNRDVNIEMIVVDNASGDESVSVIKKFSDKIIPIFNEENVGFGRANNQAFRQSSGRYLFLLNPDARLLDDHFDLINAIDYMEQHPEIGLAGTRIVDINRELQNTISDHYPRQKQSTKDFSDLPGKWACVLGASMVIRRDAFEKVNGFDEDYFLYSEETDLCLRLRQAGYQIGYLDDVTVCHIGGASAKKLPSEKVIRLKKSAKYLFYKKHYNPSDVKNIATKDLQQAKWHRLWLSLKKKIFSLSPKEEHKLARHQIAIEESLKVLQGL